MLSIGGEFQGDFWPTFFGWPTFENGFSDLAELYGQKPVKFG